MKKYSIKMLIIVMLLAIAVIPLMTSTYWLISGYDRELTGQVKEKQLQMAESNAVIMNNWLNAKIGTIEEISSRNRELLLEGDTGKIVPLLKTLKTTDPENISFSYTNADGISYGSDGVVTDFAGENNNFKSIENVQITDVMPSGGNNLIIIIVPLRNEEGTYRGNLFSVMKADILLKDLKASQQDAGADIFLLSSKGTYIAHQDEQMIGVSVSETLNAEAAAEFNEHVLTERQGTLTYKDDTRDEHVFSSFATVERTGWKVVVTGDTDTLLAEASQAKRLSLIMITVTTLIVALIALFFSRILLRPVLSLSSFMRNVATGDLSKRLDVRINNEFGQLQRSINGMLDEFSLLIRNIESTVQETVGTSAMMDRLSAHTAQDAKNISAAVSTIADHSRQQALDSEHSARGAEEISGSIRLIAVSAAAMTEHFGGVMHAVGQGSEHVQTNEAQMKGIHQYLNVAGQEVRQLLERAGEIQSIGQFIADMAKQTNILALNAGIEAARAGKQGQGFAVVAVEVKQLAAETAAAAGQIADLVNSIHNQSVRTYQSMDKGMEETERGVQITHQTGAAFAQIVQLVQGMNGQIEAVSAAAEQISAGADEISASIHDMRDVSIAAMDRLQAINETAQAQSDSMDGIAAAAAAQTGLSRQLEVLIGKFHISRNGNEHD
ncbi:methyl-accepting chemotaxis protein [Paenibacillus tepidiphilus]|uniref:methyl-accepting chemotaxis protein n=1 Tax=Paenibacillus tepidiphilus TaxID=2608683 RepID=UPI0013A5B9C6|nr:methyl-accepting chemotaxis protein [Paenibacillus tepidiphilus]